MKRLDELEWRPARPGSLYLVRYALIDRRTRVTEEVLGGAVSYGVQRRGKAGWGVSTRFPTLDAALEHAERLAQAGAGEEPRREPPQPLPWGPEHEAEPLVEGPGGRLVEAGRRGRREGEG